MGNSISAPLAIVALTLTFQGLLYGGSLIDASYPALRTVDFDACNDATGWTRGIEIFGCYIGNVLLILINAVVLIFGTVVFFVNLITFNVPGAPTFVRFLVGATLGASVLWIVIATLFRGTKA